MYDLFIKDLVVEGPGDTFRIDVVLSIDIELPTKNDSVSEVYDTHDLRRQIKECVAWGDYVLLETLAVRIADKLCSKPRVRSVEVALMKLTSAQGGTPGVIVRR